MPAPAAVVDWIRSAAVPLATTEPRRGFDDLAPLRAFIGDARIVSLGEATHGTREFFTLKHRVLEFCVAELGFTMFCIEASFPECLAVNAYVLDGAGDAAEALAGTRFWTWNTAEVLDLIEWMRWWNVHHERKVKFYGFDMQSPAVATLGLIDYLDRVAPDLAAQCRTELAPLASDVTASLFKDFAEPRRGAVLACVARMRHAFMDRRDQWVARTSSLDWHLGRLHATVLDQGARPLDRDRAMAENVCALLDAEGPDARAVLWAHNGHTARATYKEHGKAMGQELDELVGRKQVTIGFSFDRGAFQARAWPSGDLMDHHVVGAVPDSFDAALAQAGVPLFWLDLAHAPRDGEVAAWLATEMPMRMIGAVSDVPGDGYGTKYAYPTLPRAWFDAILFVAETTAARRNTLAPAPAPLHLHAAPTNLALAGDGLPAGWHVLGARDGKADATTGTDPSPSSGRTICLTRHAEPRRWGDVRLVQKIDASGWQGRRVRFSAAVRTDVADTGTGALLLVRFLPKPEDEAGELFLRDIAMTASSDAPVQSPQWTDIAVEADVPDAAHTCVLALILSGNGRAWFGDLAFEMSNTNKPIPSS